MAEAEDVLVDAARHASAAALDLWRRHEARIPGRPQVLLTDCRARLALLVEGVLGVALEIRTAQAPAPMSWLARRLRGAGADGAHNRPLPASDGRAVYLPAALDASAGEGETPSRYALLALLQALRCTRGSAWRLPACGSPLVLDLFVLAEAAAADHALRALLPGWQAALDRFYADRAAVLAQLRPRNPAQAEILTRYRGLLGGDLQARVPQTRSADEALGWARDEARRLADRGGRYRSWLVDEVVGRLLAPEAAPDAAPDAGRTPGEGAPRPARTTTMPRRPRARAASADEDDAQPGPWMVQTSQPHEHAEDPLGLQRPQDCDTDGAIAGLADSLAELESARLVRTPERAGETLVGPDAPPRLEGTGHRAETRHAIEYPEWDYRLAAYRSRAARLHVVRAPAPPSPWADAVLARNQATLREIRRRFGALRPHRHTFKHLADGDDIDCDALIEERTERRAGLSPPGAVYQSRRPAPRRLGLLLLLDASGSTEAWVADALRVIDVEKEAALLAACALDAAQIEFAVLAFSGEGPGGVCATRIKDFDEPWSEAATARLAALAPDRFTRMGAPLRHAAALLSRRPLDLRLLLLLSDGRPNDCDHYATRYGIEDTRQAIAEARLQHIDPYCFTVDPEGGAYLPHLFGPGRYTVVRRPQQLTQAFIDWLRAAARRALR